MQLDTEIIVAESRANSNGSATDTEKSKVCGSRADSADIAVRQLRALRALAGGYANRAMPGARRFSNIRQ